MEYIYPEEIKERIKGILDLFSSSTVLWVGKFKDKDIFFLVIASNFPHFHFNFVKKFDRVAGGTKIFIGPPNNMGLMLSYHCFFREDHTGSVLIEDDIHNRGYKSKTMYFFRSGVAGRKKTIKATMVDPQGNEEELELFDLKRREQKNK